MIGGIDNAHFYFLIVREFGFCGISLIPATLAG